jgi:hypothetical protein
MLNAFKSGLRKEKKGIFIFFPVADKRVLWNDILGCQATAEVVNIQIIIWAGAGIILIRARALGINHF